MTRRLAPLVATLAVLGAACTVFAGPAQARVSWPQHGQLAYAIGTGHIHAGPHQHAAPIASVAKVMTAYLVLRTHPLHGSAPGFVLRVTRRDVADFRRRVARGESTVPVRVGERLTERQALAALLLPSANNVAVMLARRVSGSVARFARLMTATARALGMRHTTYTDPSGFDARTRSSAADQVRLALVAMRTTVLRRMVSRSRWRIPVAGVVHNTDVLLHHDGFAGIKTGSMDASGGCFMFRSRRWIHGARVWVTGVVLGQRGGPLVLAGQRAARAFVNRLAPRAA